MRISNYLFIQIVCLFLGLLNISKANNLTEVPKNDQDSIVLINGHICDIVSASPDTLKVKAKIIFETIPHGNEIGIISSTDSGFYEYHINTKAKYRVSIFSNLHKDYTEIIELPSSALNSGINHNYYLEPQLKEDQVIRLNNLIFEQGEAVITVQSYRTLNRLVNIMNNNKSMQIQLEGHTDFRGSKKLNMELSNDRVLAVKEYLVAKGIAGRRVKTKAFGGSQPLTREKSIESSSVNRRVEMRILKLKQE